MRLIDADELLKKFCHGCPDNDNGDNCIMNHCADYDLVLTMPTIDAEPFKAFAHWVASEVCNEGFEDMWSLGAFAEVACRKLHALGVVQKFRDEWVYVDKDELDGGENG